MKIGKGTSFVSAFRYAFAGIREAINEEQRFQLEFIVGIFVLFGAWYFTFSPGEMMILILTIGFVLSTELFNTSLERLADAVQPNENQLIKVAKDTSAAAVLIAVVVAVSIGVYLFLPRLAA